jgi:hypothetical protein
MRLKLNRHRALALSLRVISAQTRCAFVARKTAATFHALGTGCPVGEHVAARSAHGQLGIDARTAGFSYCPDFKQGAQSMERTIK